MKKLLVLFILAPFFGFTQVKSVSFSQTKKISNPLTGLWPKPKSPFKDSINPNWKVKSIEQNNFFYQGDTLTKSYFLSSQNYDNEGQVTEKKIRKWVDNSETKEKILRKKNNYTKLIYYNDKLSSKKTYNHQDSLLSEVMFNSNYNTKREYIRDEKGRLTHIITKSTNTSYEYFTYSDKGKILERLFVNHVKDTSFKYIYYYDEKGRLSSRDRPMNSYNIGPITEFFLYDNKGNLISEKWVKHELGDTIEIIKNIYTYNENSYTLQKDYRRWNDNRLIKSDVYTYDDNDNMIRKCSRLQCRYYQYYSDGKLASFELREEDLPTYITHYFYSYNEVGLLIMQEDKSNNGLWVWEYDDNNRLITEKIYEKSDLKKEKIYTYTDFGLLKQEQVLNYSNESVERKTIIKYDYIYFK